MKKLGWTMMGLALGSVLTLSLVSRATAQEGRLTLYGEAPKGAASGSKWTFSFEDAKTGKVVAKREGSITVKDGRYMAEVDRDGLEPGKLYSINVNGEAGEELAMVTFVTLQATTPGVVESGNINVSGTILATTKIGVGTGSMPYMLNARTTSATGGTFSQSGGNGVRGVSTALTGAFAGGSFNGSSPEGYGVFGINSATMGKAYGGYFKTSSPTGTALHGDTVNNSGEELGVGKVAVRGTARVPSEFADNSIGVLGEAIVTNAITNYGVLGSLVDEGLSNGWAVYANGPLGTSGTKEFQIDDPRDPEHAWLRHYCSEGAEPLLIYSGTATLDGSGSATVKLPAYWSTINKDPRYQLTAIGASMPNLYIASKVKNNQFTIGGGKVGTEVAWTVLGTRNDPYVQRAGIQNEIRKPRSSAGKLYHPSLYGKAKDKALFPAAGSSETAINP